MTRTGRVLLAAAAAATATTVAVAQTLPPVKKIVVLMQENRSFDHFLGYLKKYHNSEIDGLWGNETNPYDPTDLSLGYVTVSDDSGYVTDPDPGHGVNDVTEQSFGTTDPADQNVPVPPMNGYVVNYRKRGDPEGGASVMRCFNPDDLPVSTTLATEFGIIDHWYCSVAGPTMPNRYYLMSATSNGVANNAVPPIVVGFPQKSLFKALEENGRTWANYFEEGAADRPAAPTAIVFKDTRVRDSGNFRHFSKFAEDVANGQLADFSMIDPIYFGLPRHPADDDHPDHDVSLGQALMKRVYEPLRASQYWNETLLIITYDEHGGFYDHDPVPRDVPNPDGLVSDDPQFDFTRLGPRVPAIFVSPYIARDTVLHQPSAPYPGESKFDHASVSATLRLFNFTAQHLTERDAWSGTFEGIFTSPMPRTDTPVTLPEPRPLGFRKVLTYNEPLSGLQKELVQIAAGLNGIADPPVDTMTCAQAAAYVRRQIEQFFGRQMYPDDEWEEIRELGL